MSIKTILTCDCGAKLELDGPYHTVKEAMRAKGWRNMKDGEGWKIRCPECKGK
jgi:hypothetical protein